MQSWILEIAISVCLLFSGYDINSENLLLKRGSLRLAEMTAEQTQVLDAYGAFLAGYVPQRTESGIAEVPAFALIYLDGDDVPELVVIEGYAHACGGYVHTFADGQVIPVGEGYGQYGAMAYREKEGIVFGAYDAFGNVHTDVYQIEGKTETLLQSYSEIWEFSEEKEEVQATYTVDGQEVSEERYKEVSDKWNKDGDKTIQYNMCRTLADGDIRSALQEELETLILTQEKVLKENLLTIADAQESDILLLDYDDFDGDGRYEAFMICGESYEEYGAVRYRGALYFAGADCCMLVRRNSYSYRMIDGKMEFGGNRKYLFFHTNLSFTATISELWTVEDGQPVESEFSGMGQVVYRGGDDFEIWRDAYDGMYDTIDELWSGHTWKPYFYHYSYSSNQIEKYEGKIISGEKFAELSGTNLIEEIEAEGYIVGTIILWENDIVTINYEVFREESGFVIYNNVIWDNKAKDFWRKDERHVTSWENAGEGGSYEV